MHSNEHALLVAIKLVIIGDSWPLQYRVKVG